MQHFVVVVVVVVVVVAATAATAAWSLSSFLHFDDECDFDCSPCCCYHITTLLLWQFPRAA